MNMTKVPYLRTVAAYKVKDCKSNAGIRQE